MYPSSFHLTASRSGNDSSAWLSDRSERGKMKNLLQMMFGCVGVSM